MFLIFDTETTGLPKKWSAPLTDFDNWPRAIQVAWQVHDKNGICISNQSFIIHPKGFSIPYDSEKIHGISTQLAKKIGESSKVAVRNIRRDGIEQYKKMEKEKEIGEDDSKKLQSDVENLTSEHIKMIDSIVLEKEADLSKV